MKTLIWILAVLLLSTAVWVVNSPTAKGRLKAMTWSESETLQCVKENTIVLENRTVTNPLAEVVIAGDGCDITLKNCALKAPTPINVAGDARVTIEGGKLEGEQIAMIVGAGEVTLRDVEVTAQQIGIVVAASGKATVEGGKIEARTPVDARETSLVRIDGTKLFGETHAIKAIGQARVAVTPASKLRGEVLKEGFGMVAMDGDLEAEKDRLAVAEKKADKQKLLFDKYSQDGCKGFHECFLKAELEGGMIDGEIRMPVDDKGRVKGARITFDVPGISKCIQKVARDKRIAKFRGPAGFLICRFNGVVQKEEGSVAYESAYEAAEPSKEKAKEKEKHKRKRKR